MAVTRTEVFETAERLLPKYGGIPWLALNQATLLHMDKGGPRWSPVLTEKFEEWLEARKETPA